MKPQPPYTVDPKRMSIPIRLPKSSVHVLERIAALAQVDLQTVIQVMMAVEIEHAIANGIIKRRKR